MYKDANHYTIYKRGNIFGYYYYDSDNKRHFRSTGRKTKYEAQKVINDRIKNGELAFEKQAGFITFKEYTQNFFIVDKCPILAENKRTGKKLSDGTLYSYRKALESHLWPHLGDKYICNISAKDIKAMEDGFIKEGLAPSSINIYDNVLRQIMKKAQRDELVSQNIFENHQSMHIDKEESRRRAFDISQISLILNAPWPDKLYMIAFRWACFTGMRCGEFQSLRVDAISDGFIHVYQTFNHNTGKIGKTKTKEERFIPLPSSLKEDYEYLSKGKSPESLLFSVDGKKILNNSQMNRYLKDVMEKTGIVSDGLTFHSCRHFFDTYMSGETDIKKEKIMEVMGHKSDNMYHHYLHLAPKHLEDVRKAQDELTTKLTT